MTHMQIRDVSLFVEVMGKGLPLVLMHGGPSLDFAIGLAFALLLLAAVGVTVAGRFRSPVKEAQP